MTFPKDVWFAYVINHIIENCKNVSTEQCKGCQLKWKSAILHQHEQLSLLEKIIKHLDSVRGNLLGIELEGLFKHFAQGGTISASRKKELLNQTKTLILCATPQSLYYGRWMSDEYEIIFQDMFARRRRKRRAAKKAKALEAEQSALQSLSKARKRKRRRQLLEFSSSPAVAESESCGSSPILKHPPIEEKSCRKRKRPCQLINFSSPPAVVDSESCGSSPILKNPSMEEKSIERLLWEEIGELLDDDE